LQRAFAEGFAVQCGFCAPGMILAAKCLLDRNSNPSREDVVDAISGNICRCTGYESIINAILAAAAEMRGEKAA
jgi:aerobic carbon-monoxide dehydrogenase small subunit